MSPRRCSPFRRRAARAPSTATGNHDHRGDHGRSTCRAAFPLGTLAIGALVVVVIGAAAILLGWDIRGWFADLWDTLTTISLGALLAAVALKTVQTTAAYSVAEELVTTAWNLLFAIVLMAWAFGWSGGEQLVSGAYAGAKKKQAERKAARRAKKEAQAVQ